MSILDGVLVYTDAVNVLGDNKWERRPQKLHEPLVRRFMSRHHNAGQNRSIKISQRKSFENMVKGKDVPLHAMEAYEGKEV
jgi:hypothetical protein